MDYPSDGGSGFADFADPSTDSATVESQRICKIINENYFPEVKINYVPHSNANTKYYYMWKYLTALTPCVLLEMGQSIDPHDKVLLANTELIASAIVRCICKAFDVSYEITPPVVVTPPAPVVDVEALKNTILELNTALETEKTKSKDALAVKTAECQEKIKAYKEKIINFINLL
jgi:hypothetical protein